MSTFADVRLVIPALLLITALLPGVAAADPTGEALAREARLELILPLVLRANPDLAEAEARIAAARAQARLAGRLPEAQVKYEQWGLPLRRPLAWREGNALMVGLSQTLPAAGTRSARARAADQEAVRAAAGAETRRRDLTAEVRRGFAEYFRADREVALHREHVELTGRLVELARSSYRAGQRSQQDVLRLTLELSRLHRDLAHVEQERISASARLNLLMNRPLEAPLGVPAELPPAAAPPGDAGSARGRSELVAAGADLARSEATLELVQREGRWPTVTLGVDYMYMPMMAAPHGYGLMVMMNLPWLSAGRRDAVAAAEHALAADRLAVQSVRNGLAYQARDAGARFAAARATFDIIDRDLLPIAGRNLETAQAGYGAGRGDASVLVDALRSYLDTRLDRVQSLVHLEEAAADLARALPAEVAP